MCEDQTGATGGRARFQPMEVRRIILAEGNEFHNTDADARESWRRRIITTLESNPSAWHGDTYSERIYNLMDWGSQGLSDQEVTDRLLPYYRNQRFRSNFAFLREELGESFEIASGDMTASYQSTTQRVRYELEIKHTKSDFKTALETEGIIVVYSGHSRYGRGACFDDYGTEYHEHGEQWEAGTGNNSGIFRLGHPYVGIPFEDIEHHHYHFCPLAAETPRPTVSRRHPRRTHREVPSRLQRITLPEELRGYVNTEFASTSNQYWGYRRRGKVHILLIAGWDQSGATPYDLGATNLQCRTFCHFGCSSKDHFWDIVRRPEYKDFRRNRPPTHGLAYFTREPSNWKSIYWLYFLLAYEEPNTGSSHYWNSHEYAKQMTNRRLQREDQAFRIY